ncbi:large conductance mechanosensitive channel protein MscL [Meiothermus sp. QL-1]|uniref:large conductance mechanosensitive channel protein MscL n=1 Tax=Meiothermus sp. QL-1 TaxID=2058095 RepID=UPI000E0B3CA9|nr:large conductance mechanosensitive channel protein MscL [Meiothermus sp. QL-1]RDI96738.1 large conductance mechanosensitive channel protein MscL [Meiothermus sp. QL-1]
MLEGFRQFILRGNALDLAVGVMIGGAFGAVLNSLVADVLTPLIGMLFSVPDFSALKLGPLNLGKFINAVVSFLMVALALYFLVVLPINRLQAPKQNPPVPEEIRLLQEIRDALKNR